MAPIQMLVEDPGPLASHRRSTVARMALAGYIRTPTLWNHALDPWPAVWMEDFRQPPAVSLLLRASHWAIFHSSFDYMRGSMRSPMITRLK